MLKCAAVAVASALGYFFLQASALAVDGQRIITQEGAIKGGITPEDTPGYPVTIARPGSYKLGSDLQVGRNARGIVVTHSDVSIDLNGWTIRGPSQNRRGWEAILSSAPGLSMRNGTILYFTTGIRTTAAALIDGMTVSMSVNGIRGSDLTIRNTIVEKSLGSGVECGGYCLVSDSTIYSNGSQASKAQGGLVINRGLVERTNIINNRQVGLRSASWDYEDEPQVLYGNCVFLGNSPKHTDGYAESIGPNAVGPVGPGS